MTAFKFTRTKIVATLGPACDDEQTLRLMVREGMDVARLNFSHGTHAEHHERLKRVREINKKLGTSVAILQDLQGPKIRIGDLDEDFPVKRGQIVTFRSDIEKLTDGAIPIQYSTFARDVEVGQHVLFDDGKVEATVVETDKDQVVKIRIEFGQVLKRRKGVNLPETTISIPTITEKDFRDIDFAIEHDVEWLALSFVRNRDDIRTLKELIRLKKGRSKIVAKIEKPEALRCLDEIIAETDAVMVARGDLGVEIPLEEVPAVQKRIIRKANQAGKPVIIATQVMETMTYNRRPTRAETSDVANGVVDGTDALMLSGETSVGKYPVQVIASMNSIIRNVEREGGPFYYTNMALQAESKHPLSEAIVATACRLAQETDAKAIIAFSRSGYTAYQLSRCRPEAKIYVFTSNEHLITSMNLLWGVRAFYYNKHIPTDDAIADVQQQLKELGHVEEGDVVINTAATPLHQNGLTNMVRIGKIN